MNQPVNSLIHDAQTWSSVLYLNDTPASKLAEIRATSPQIFYNGENDTGKNLLETLCFFIEYRIFPEYLGPDVIVVACEQALGGMEEERLEEGLYANLQFYCSAPFLTFL